MIKGICGDSKSGKNTSGTGEMLKKLTSVIEKAKEIGRKIAGHAEQTRVSLRAKLVEAQEETRRQNEERKPVQKKNDITR